MRVHRRNAESLNIEMIEALAAPAKGNKFCGHNMRGV